MIRLTKWKRPNTSPIVSSSFRETMRAHLTLLNKRMLKHLSVMLLYKTVPLLNKRKREKCKRECFRIRGKRGYSTILSYKYIRVYDVHARVGTYLLHPHVYVLQTIDQRLASKVSKNI